MTYNYNPRPVTTPKVIQILIWITCLTSVLSVLLQGIFVNYFRMMGPQEFLSLSWYGVTHFYLWQFITYLFIQPGYGLGVLDFSLAISLVFNMYILWMVGSVVWEHLGTGAFLRLYFFSGIFAGLCAFGVISLGETFGDLAGPLPALFALMVVWTMLHPEANLIVFLLFPMKAKWIVATLFGIITLMEFSEMDYVSLAALFGGTLYGYLYGVLVLGLQGPFEFSRPFENFVFEIRDKVKSLFASDSVHSKIYDFKTGKAVVSDDEFVDAMLAKIAKKGESSLTWSERRRLDKIAKRKKQGK